MDLDPRNVIRDARAFCAEHEALRAFVAKREGAPGEGENVLNVVPYGHVKGLHVGRGRAATLYDEQEDVCWILAYSPTHAFGARDDAYRLFERLSGRDELLPTAVDYGNIAQVSPASLIDVFAEVGTRLYEEARANPNTEINQTLELVDGSGTTMLIVVDLQIIDGEEVEQGWVAFTFPSETALTADQVLDLLASILPPAVDLTTLEVTGQIGDRVMRYDEVAYTWSSYPD